MRQAMSGTPSLNHDDKFFYLVMGFNYVAEHEFGCDDILEALNVDPATGSVHKFPEDLFRISDIPKSKNKLFSFDTNNFYPYDWKRFKEDCDYDFGIPDRNALVTTWKRCGFAVTLTKEMAEHLLAMFKELKVQIGFTAGKFGQTNVLTLQFPL